MAIDLRKRIEELERENERLRHLVDSDPSTDKLTCDVALKSNAKLHAKVDQLERENEDLRERIVDLQAARARVNKYPARVDEALTDQQKREAWEFHKRFSEAWIDPQNKPTIFQRLKGLLPWN